MDTKYFIEQMGTILYKSTANHLDLATPFKECREWNFLQAASLVLMIEEEYQVYLNDRDLIQTETLGDLYGLILDRKMTLADCC